MPEMTAAFPLHHRASSFGIKGDHVCPSIKLSSPRSIGCPGGMSPLAKDAVIKFGSFVVTSQVRSFPLQLSDEMAYTTY